MNKFKESIYLILMCLLLLGCNIISNKKTNTHPFELKISNHEYPLELQLDTPWEERGLGYINIFKSDTLWHLWYESFGENSLSSGKLDYNSYFCYAQSKDGINWIKPNLNYTAYGDYEQTNILISNNGIPNNGIHGMTVFLDPNASKSEGPYKMVYARWIDSLSSNWVYGMTSNNGKVWENERLIKRHYSDTQTVSYFYNGNYKLYYRFWSGNSHGRGFRQVGYSEAKTFDISLGDKHEEIKFKNKDVSKLHLYNNATRVVNGEYELMFPSVYKPEEDVMEPKVAYRRIDDINKEFTFYEPENQLFKGLPNFRVLYVAPQVNEISEGKYLIYYSYKEEGHNTILDDEIQYTGKIGRFILEIK